MKACTKVRRVWRRGVSSIWLLAAMPAVVGFCSLAVDYGHVQLVKAELRVAADAAARYAVTGLASGVTTTQAYAVDAANDNTADGTPVNLNSTTDIEFGDWDPAAKTFTVLTGTARANADAVRITARRTAATGNAVQLGFARLIGKSTADVTAVAIATIQAGTGPGYGVVGLDFVYLAGSGRVDSYNSASGAYSLASSRSYSSVASNAYVYLTGSSTIHGDAHPGTGYSVYNSGSSTVTGSQSPLTTTLTYAAPTLPSSYTNGGALNLAGGQSLTLSAGNYYFNGFNVAANAQLHISGQVTVYVAGNFSFGGNADTYGALPKNFRVRMLTAGSTVSVSANSDVYADIYAPQSYVTITGSGDIYGAVISKGLIISGTGGMHYDESLGYGTSSSTGSGGASGSISLVK